MRPLLVLLLLAAACAEPAASPAEGPSDAGGDVTPGSPADTAGLEADALDSASDAGSSGDTVGAAPEPPDLAVFVDPRIGTSNSGNVAVGAAVPHGWVRLGPDTANEALDIAAYRWGATQIEGFTHTQLSGAGGSGYGYSHLLVMPVAGEATLTGPDAWRADFSHDDERVEAGFYSVRLATGVSAELTATGLAGLHRYTFPAGRARLVLDVGHSLGKSVGGRVEPVDARTLRGYGDYQVHPTIAFLLGDGVAGSGRLPTGALRVYFTARLSRDAVAVSVAPRGAPCPTCTGAAEGSDLVAELELGVVPEGDVVGLEVGVSLVDEATALRNLDGEVNAALALRPTEGAIGRFEAVRAAARHAWNLLLSRAQVVGPDDAKTVFYTALYHTLLQPADLTERGPSGPVYATAFDGILRTHPAGQRRYYTDDWCGWDTFRTSHPLRTLLEPEVMGDLIESYVHAWREGGWLDVCPWAAAGYSRVMIGNTAFPMVADAVLKGLDDFDHEDAWSALLQSADHYLDNPLAEGACGYLELGTPDAYRELGYVPDECDPTQAASMTLEYAYQDACLATVAERWGHQADAERLWVRSGSWRNHWNPAIQHMQSRLANGAWREPFDPADGSAKSGFVESTAWTYTFHVPHDVPALIELMGGEAGFRAKLDAFFAGGHFDMSNEPGFHIPWLYALAGAPAESALRVRGLLAKHFSTTPGGLPGNDDSGATSAWAAFSQLGLYPVSLADARYVLGSPVFDKATLALVPGGPPLVIRAQRGSPDAMVLKGATLDGVPVTTPWVTHEQLLGARELVLTLDP